MISKYADNYLDRKNLKIFFFYLREEKKMHFKIVKGSFIHNAKNNFFKADLIFHNGKEVKAAYRT